MYTIDELVRAARKQFGLPDFLVKSALELTGKKEFTLEEARQIINDFAFKKVS